MRGLAGCPKIQKSKNPSFQTESLDSGQKDGFLDFRRVFFWIFLDSSKGCLDFWVSKSKIKKNSRKKMDSCKNPTSTCIFLDFLEKSIFFLKFFWIFDIRIEKIHLFPRCFWIFAKIHLFPWVFYFFWKFHLFPWVFLDFWLGNPKIQTPFRRIQKNQKKTLGTPKIHLFDLNPKILFEKMDFWIFGFLVEQSSEIQDFIVWTWIQVFKLKDGLLYFCFHFLAEFRRLKKRINQEWLQLSFDLREQASCILYVFFHGFFIISYCIDMYIYACPP